MGLKVVNSATWVPSAASFTTRSLYRSAIYTWPAASTATPVGLERPRCMIVLGAIVQLPPAAVPASPVEDEEGRAMAVEAADAAPKAVVEEDNEAKGGNEEDEADATGEEEDEHDEDDEGDDWSG